MTEIVAETPDVPASKPRRWDWRPKLRWLAAEILVVVVGVLIALALNAWWGNRQDAAKEQAYLHQLAADLHETEQVIAVSDSVMANRVEPAAIRLFQSFGSSDRPPKDSVLAWVKDLNWIETPRPVLGTAEALIATGDLALIRDDSLRSNVTAYVDETRRLLEEQARTSDETGACLKLIFRRADPWEWIASLPERELEAYRQRFPLPGFLPNPEWEAPFPSDTDTFYRDPDVYFGVWCAGSAAVNALARRRDMRGAAEALRARVERAIAR